MQAFTSQGKRMPNILVKIPRGAFPDNCRASLVQRINDAAAVAEQIPADSRDRFLCWVLIDEADAGQWTCGGIDVAAQIIPCVAMIYLPVGVLDAASRAQYVKLMHAAFADAMPTSDRRKLATSVVIHEVPDGTWGVNGTLWHLPDFAQAAGFSHLRHLVKAA